MELAGPPSLNSLSITSYALTSHQWVSLKCKDLCRFQCETKGLSWPCHQTALGVDLLLLLCSCLAFLPSFPPSHPSFFTPDFLPAPLPLLTETGDMVSTLSVPVSNPHQCPELKHVLSKIYAVKHNFGTAKASFRKKPFPSCQGLFWHMANCIFDTGKSVQVIP